MDMQDLGGEESSPDLRQVSADLCNLRVRSVGSHKELNLPRLLKESR
jgi:hypothetical protein